MRTLYITPHPSLPLKGEGEGGGDVILFISFVLEKGLTLF